MENQWRVLALVRNISYSEILNIAWGYTIRRNTEIWWIRPKLHLNKAPYTRRKEKTV